MRASPDIKVSIGGNLSHAAASEFKALLEPESDGEAEHGVAVIGWHARK